MAYATIADIEGVLMRPLDTRESEYAPAMLEYAEAVIFERVRSAMSKSFSSEHYRRIVVHVEAAMVARVLRNPDGIYKSESDGDYSYTVDTAIASGNIYLSAEEMRALTAGASGWGSLSAGTVDAAARRKGWPSRVCLPVEMVDSLAHESSLEEAGVEVLREID